MKIDPYLDSQYDNRTAVPEHPDIFADWSERSRQAREHLSADLDLAYGPTQREMLDLFFPKKPSPGLPLVVFIHGGYWKALDKSFFSFVAGPFVQQGYALAVVQYGLCPDVSIKQICSQVNRAMNWLAERAGEYSIDPGRVHLIGHSAGGQLAAMLNADHQLFEPCKAITIKSITSISGVFDLEPLIQTPLNSDLNLDQCTVREVSPISYAPLAPVPTLLLVGGGESDEFKRQSGLLQHHWQPKSVPIQYLEIPAANHFTILNTAIDPDSETHKTILRQLR